MPAVQVHSSTTRGSAADATETTDAGCWSTCGQSTATDGSLWQVGDKLGRMDDIDVMVFGVIVCKKLREQGWLIDWFIGFGSQRLDYNAYIQTYIQQKS